MKTFLLPLMLTCALNAVAQVFYTETFNGSIGAWTTTVTNAGSRAYAWDFVPQGRRRRPLGQGTPRVPISSPTASNGAMAFSGDSIQYAISNPLVGPYPIIKGELTSPVINCSNYPVSYLRFYQRFIGLNGSNDSELGSMLAYSTDGGTNWDTLDINTGLGASNLVDNGVRLAICTNSSPNVRLKFIYEGDFYYWVVDDISLSGNSADLAIANDYVGIAYNHKTPLHQVEAQHFAVDGMNKYLTTQDMRMALNISGPNSDNFSAVDNETQVSPCTSLRPGLAPGRAEFYMTTATGPNATTPGPGAPFQPSRLGTYNGLYTLSNPASATDSFPADNTFSFNFEITDSVFAKDNGSINSRNFGGRGTSPSDVWSYGNMYHTKSCGKLTSVEIAIGNAVAKRNKTIYVYVYKWQTGQTNINLTTIDHPNFVAYAPITLDNTHQDDRPFRVSLLDPNSNPGAITLQADADYLVVVESTVRDSIEISTCEGLLNYTAVRGETGSKYSRPRLASMIIAKNTAGVLTLYPRGYGDDQIPIVRMVVQDCSIDVNQVQSEEASIELSPNPASEYLTLELGSAQLAEGLVQITDLAGRVLLTETHTVGKGSPVMLALKSLPNGAYNLTVKTEKAFASKSFIVAK